MANDKDNEQRQFPRLSAPGDVEIKDKKYKILDISYGGLKIKGLEKYDFEVGEIITLKLFLRFMDLSTDFAMLLDARIQHFDEEDGTAGVEFMELTLNESYLIDHALTVHGDSEQ